MSARHLGRAATSMSANIAEGWRSSNVDRERLLENARASAVETIAHWRQAFAAEHLQPWVFWPIHHQLVMIVRMLDAVLAE